MKKRLYLVLAVLLVWLAMAAMVLAQGTTTQEVTTSDLNVTLVLAPLAAAALGIERLLETIWGIVETALKTIKVDTTEESYVEFKTWSSAGAGLIIGLIVAAAAELRMFGLLNLAANPDLDVVVTGLVIGSGSKFTHDIIGIFTEGKRSLEQWRKLLQDRRNATRAD